jgi:hypothetical protein
MYRLRPSGDWIGQPSMSVVFSSGLLPSMSSIFWAVAHVTVFACAGVDTATARSTAPTAVQRCRVVIELTRLARLRAGGGTQAR